MTEIEPGCRCEGLRHTRNMIAKQFLKERQRKEAALSQMQKFVAENELLVAENETLKRKLKFIEDRYT